jgi:hypothetical protein
MEEDFRAGRLVIADNVLVMAYYFHDLLLAKPVNLVTFVLWPT